jgi:tRNA threonylcarbamoyladenosine biosynthesis protein TsaB
MLILAIDTSGQSGGITLAEADTGSFRVIESATIAGGTFSAQLIPTLAALLKKHGYGVKDIGGFAAASGPGSFTGLRVGLSAIKGLAETLHKPIATVSVLQAVAAGMAWAGSDLSVGYPTCRVAMDASRNEVFFGDYLCVHPFTRYEPAPPVFPRMMSESLITLSELADRIREWDASANLTTPDGTVIEALKKLLDSHLLSRAFGDRFSAGLFPLSRPTSEDIARIGARKLLAGETVSVEALDANYLRRSDAEIFFKGNR